MTWYTAPALKEFTIWLGTKREKVIHGKDLLRDL